MGQALAPQPQGCRVSPPARYAIKYLRDSDKWGLIDVVSGRGAVFPTLDAVLEAGRDKASVAWSVAIDKTG